MTTRSLFAVSILGLVACGVEGPGVGAIGVEATALKSTCEAGTTPQQAVDRVEVLVTGSDRDTGKTVILAKGSQKISAATQDVALGSVPVGLDNVVTVLGFAPGKEAPTWFGRRREVAVTQDRTTDLEMVLTHYGEFTCLDAPQTFTQRAFASTVALGDGRVLMTGGFTSATDAGDGAFALGGAAKNAYIYDPAKGSMTEIGSMTEARAGHSMVYLPLAGGEKVLVFGGTTKMTMKAGSFPLNVDTNDSLLSYEVFDVTTSTFASPGNDRAGNPKQMLMKRAFPSVGRLFDNTVLITGGGRWPLDSATYNVAEMWAPYADKDENGENPRGGLLDLNGSLKLNRQHNGAAITKLEDTSQGLSRYLIVGGTTESDSVVEIFTQSSKQEEGAGGAFRRVSVNGLPLLFFPAVVPLQETAEGAKRFLVAGGAVYSGGKLNAPQAKAWLLKVQTTDATVDVTAESIDAPCAARFFHEGVGSFEADSAVLLGGYTDFDGTANGGACFFDLATKAFTTPSGGQPDFFPRAGHAVERLIDDTLLVAGGLVDAAGLSDGSSGLLELYAPPVLKTNLAQ